ncbi:MAG: hypothetical protein KDD51_15795 [Bdellovibrionales bacterium]|nr:hypothetical protein [Bdellovibrionales bacterium]
MKSAFNLLVVAILLVLFGCGEPQPGEMRGRLGGNGAPSTTLQRTGTSQSLVPPQNYRPRAQSMRFNTGAAKTQIDRRLQQGDFNKDNVPTLASLREIRGPKKVTLNLPGGSTVNASGMCLMASGIVENDSDLSISEGPCPGDAEAVRNSELALKARTIPGRPSTVRYFEILLNGVAIGRFSGASTFAKHDDGTFFPQGARRYWLLDLCTTRDIPAGDPSGLTTQDYERACLDAGLLS